MARVQRLITIGVLLGFLSCSDSPGLFEWSPRVIDGDTLHVDGERVRLVGIDAPELPGHCRPGRRCVSGDPYLSKWALEQLTLRRGVHCRPEGRDRYGRVLATCWADGARLGGGYGQGINLNQYMLEGGYAQPYRP